MQRCISACRTVLLLSCLSQALGLDLQYVTAVNADNYDSVVLDKDKDVVLLVEKTTGCPECANDLVPVQLETLAWRVSKMEAVTVAYAKRADPGMEKLLPQKVTVSASAKATDPEVWLFNRGHKGTPYDFDEEPWGEALVNIHTVHAYTDFILANRFWTDDELKALDKACGPRCTKGRMEHEQPEAPSYIDVEAERAKVEKRWKERHGIKDEL